MARNPKLIHDAEQLNQWLQDMAVALGNYRRSLLDAGFPEPEVTMMVQRMECEVFGFYHDEDGWEYTPE